VTATMSKPDPNLKILHAIAGGARSLAELKKAMRRDVRGAVNQLTKDGSVEKVEGALRLTKRGAGRLRFAS
jgi:predicted transcriptional regulator